MISNPVSTIDEHTGVIVVYVQASDGQVSTRVHVFVYMYMYCIIVHVQLKHQMDR